MIKKIKLSKSTILNFCHFNKCVLIFSRIKNVVLENFIYYFFSLIDTQPNTCKRAGNFLNEHPTKRIKTLKNLQNPFQLKSCENSKNLIYFQKLANIRFSNEKYMDIIKKTPKPCLRANSAKFKVLTMTKKFLNLWKQ